jgi:HTH-type transcriptional regulator/antitoxin HigA
MINKEYKESWMKILRKRELSQQTIADMFNFSLAKVNLFFSNPKNLTLELYTRIEKVLELSEEEVLFFKPYIEYLKEEQDCMDRLAKFHTILDIKELQKQPSFPKDIKKGDVKATLEAIKNYFGQTDYISLQNFLTEQIVATNSLFRRSQFGANPSNANLFVFCEEARKQFIQKKKLVKIKPYNKTKLEKLLDNVLPFTLKEDGLLLFIKELESCGITILHLKHLKKTYLDGASFIIDKHPVIVLTLRLSKNDNVWFSMLHELAHLLYDEEVLLSGQVLLNEGTMGEVAERQREARAEAFAREKLRIPNVVSYGREWRTLDKDRLMTIAKDFGIGADIALGALQYAKFVPYSAFNDLKYDVEELLSNYLKLEGDSSLCG